MDAGSMAIIVQGIVAGIALVLGVLTLYWGKFKRLLGFESPPKNDAEIPPEDESPPKAQD
jgi:hypothetical protein